MYKTNKNNKKRGFSLFEMMVVLAIVTFVSAVTFSSFPKMNSKLTLDLLTQDIALTIRQAQVYGTTVFGLGDQTTTGNAANYQAYGVSFPTPGVFFDDKYYYTLFADIPVAGEDTQTGSILQRTEDKQNEGTTICMTDPTKCLDKDSVICGNPRAGNECLQRFIVGGRDQISALCLNYLNSANSGDTKEQRVSKCENLMINNSSTCTSDIMSIPDTNSTVDIVFRRPKLQSLITSRCKNNSIQPTNVGIVTKSDSGETRVVVVWTNGQISIDR